MKVTPISIVIPIKRELEANTTRSLLVWTQKRLSSDELQGKLEFPGGKIEINESPNEAAIREVLEETGMELNPKKLAPFNTYTHTYGEGVSSKTVQLHAFIYEDLNESFGSPGWIRLKALDWEQEMAHRAPLANMQILADLVKVFLT